MREPPYCPPRQRASEAAAIEWRRERAQREPPAPPSWWHDDPAGVIRVASPKSEAEAPRVALQRGDSVTPEPVRWLWPGWLARGKMHILGGAPGAGKTTLALRMAATVTAGARWPDGASVSPANVVIWSGEDDPAVTLAPRLIAAGADMTRIFFVADAVEAGKSRPFDPARDMQALEAAIRATGGAALLVVDPVVSAVAADSHKNGEVRRALQPLVDLAASIGAAVVGVTHFTKGTAGRDPTERITGSLAFAALARVVLVAAKKAPDSDDDGPPTRVLMRAKSNIGTDEGGFEYALVENDLEAHPGIRATRVEWGTPVEGHARDVLADIEKAAEPAEGGAVDRAATFFRALLAGGAMAADDVRREAEGAGISWATIRRAKKSAGVTVRREGYGGAGGWLWEAST